MTRPLKLQVCATAPHLRAPWFAINALLGATLALGLGCSSTPTSGGPSPSTGGTSSTTGGAASGGSYTPPDDPYAIPASAPPPVLVATPRLARLSRPQWSNAVRDLLKLTDISEIDNGVSGDALVGFDDEADALFVTEQLRQQLADAAEKLAQKVTEDAAALARLVPADAPADIPGRARSFITAFGARAFRRPLTEDEITARVALFNQGPTLYPGVDAFKAGVSLVIQSLLQSPHFLYRTELSTVPPGAAKVPLNDYEISAKLAFALTNTMPDDELFAAAKAGQLHDPTALVAQANRLLEGSRGLAGIDNFNLQVYRLGTYDGIIRDPKVFPEFTTGAPQAMRQEVLQFLDWIFKQGHGVKEFYTAPVGFVNSALAPLYGVSGNFTADTFTKVDLDPAQRSGLLTQPGFLSSYISVDEPDIIHRGVFIATRLLCKELPPPDPKATPLGAFEPEMTNREVRVLADSYGSNFRFEFLPLSEAALVVLGASVLGWLGAWLSVGRHLRKV